MTAVSRGIGITDKEQVSRLVSTRFTRLPIRLGGAYSGILHYAMGKIKKDNIIETIRNENV